MTYLKGKDVLEIHSQLHDEGLDLECSALGCGEEVKQINMPQKLIYSSSN
jgi:hypothetical protein